MVTRAGAQKDEGLMFQQRLIRDDDALIMFEALAYLIRQSGLPARPQVPSPLHKSQGLDSIVYDERDTRSVQDWAQDSFATILDGMAIDPTDLRLIASTRPLSDDRSTLTFDPDRAQEPGQFISRLALQLIEQRMVRFNPGVPLTAIQRALIRLTGCAYYRQGFALTQCLPALTEELSAWKVPPRLVENALVFSSCLTLIVRRQTPEQIVATYGSIMSKSVRRKIRPACRQIDNFKPEVKLLQVIAEEKRAHTQSDESTMPIFTETLGDQPQRISWT